MVDLDVSVDNGPISRKGFKGFYVYAILMSACRHVNYKASNYCHDN